MSFPSYHIPAALTRSQFRNRGVYDLYDKSISVPIDELSSSAKNVDTIMMISVSFRVLSKSLVPITGQILVIEQPISPMGVSRPSFIIFSFVSHWVYSLYS
ncbi:hypothetical protein NY2A_b321L [Paramecium bursaria Chlorella virus NY2A]|uniref:Uncharacterized protein b321L n=1 Tax=Paramecium bursaria Chlorella virus NY2A TaxID=46021 RepID=A7IWJ6_PBCVN|nr:hypothetical protein NY2A_b321L [Paramecium bursaria Chlorella virus NY2A]ABT14720.1 hypothetical protein NY2A_b321L [Paramecium bursaria Chlorella virus NY2A]